jgi:DNA-directed RNA polymerase specialized sigma24 family protein
MSDFTQDNSTRPSVEFARFLESLSPDMKEAERSYVRLHKKLCGFFSLRGVTDPANAADETLERAARKICEGANVPEVESYCVGIARNVAKERWRREQRENSVFSLFVERLANNSDEEVERIQSILKPCFEQLTERDQGLLREYCRVLRGRPRAEHRRQLAETMKTTLLALRIRVTRLRTSLADCVQSRLVNS